MEQLPAEQVVGVAGGEVAMAIGVVGDYSVVLRRNSDGWGIEASLLGLRLKQIWVAGCPKPARRPVGRRSSPASTNQGTAAHGAA